MHKINIVGAGFVGLTLTEVLSRQDSVEKITVIDSSSSRVADLKEGRIPVMEVGLDLTSHKIHYTTEYSESDGDIFFICVGTPNGPEGQIDSYLVNAFNSINKVNKRATFILKSTTLPENVEKLKNFVDPLLGHFYTNPEFMAEGKAVADLLDQPQIIIGTDEEDKSVAENLMKDLFEGTYRELKVVGLKEAMVVKYFLNSYKAQKLNFINDFAWYCGMNNLSINQVLGAINDPIMGEGFDKPGIGFGGSCFPKDTQAMGKHIASCANAYNLNESRIRSFAMLISKNIEEGSMILIGGKSFKSGTNDTRESVSIKVADIIKSMVPSCHIYFYDPIAELSDLTLDEVTENKNKFNYVLLFNNLPELKEVFNDLEGVDVYDTREFV